MPFTTAHPAIVIPLKKMWPDYLSLTGLMSGAMAPDLLYFLQLTTVNRGFSHSWAGLFLFCLPAGILFSFAFHWFFKLSLIQNLPHPFDRTLSGLATSKFRPISPRDWVVLIVSVLIGTISHFFWDSFTHAQGEIAQMVPFLTSYTRVLGHPMQITTIAQHISTLIGLSVMVYTFGRGVVAPPRDDAMPERQRMDKLIFWFAGGLMAAVSGSIWVLYMHTYHPHHLVPEHTLFGLASWAGFFYCVCAYTVAKRLVGKRLAESESS